MTYAEAVQYLFEQLPMFHRIGAAAYKPDIGNILKLCNQLGNPHLQFKSIHVAGTNGKGSTSSLIASALMEQGLKVGLFTSPHLLDFRERMRINGIKISESFVTHFVLENKATWEQIQPSFFEITTAMAFSFFAREKVDIAIIEVGMGGRLDSTNIIQPELTVITSIGKDHMQFLGDTIEKIAFEKAGIIKNNTPVILGNIESGATQVIEQVALSKNAEVIHAKNIQAPSSALQGNYQIENEKTAFAALSELQQLGWKLNAESIRLGFENVIRNTKLRGRWEMINQSPLTIAEVAHNEDGIRFLCEKLNSYNNTNIHVVLGMVADKDHQEVLSLFPKKANYYFCHANIPRALPAAELQRKAAAVGLTGEAYHSAEQALNAAKKHALNEDLIVVTGSIFTVAEILPPED
ncbi:MAG: bifunctional folylpolyglutamate synthase/dihydrofolate synthase [Bacteroidota bacterium]|jgi:dihydrofolate synthase/folylpolyglutamate synthase